jgi:hypothetical protein
MQPLSEDELRKLLRQWKAPATPSSLERKILAAAEPSRLRSWLQWLTTGSIRVPVPLGIAAIIVMLALAFQATRVQKPPQDGLSQFQAVKEFKPRIIRSSSYEGN